MECEIIGGNPNPKLADLNNKVIQKLYELVDSLDSKSEPDMVRACVESLAKLNSSLKNSGILPQEESDGERREREEKETIMEAMTS
jgi:short-subunit dehydrogenase involved in D-alanine esterification of teichoic acids